MLSVPLLGGVRGEFMVLMHGIKVVEALSNLMNLMIRTTPLSYLAEDSLLLLLLSLLLLIESGE